MLTIADCDIFAEGLDHPEGLTFHKDGNLWVGGEAGQIYRISPEGKVETVAKTGGFVLGLAFSPGCEWLAVCDLGNKCVWRLDPADGRLTPLADSVAGRPIRIPNYPVFDRAGNLYVSDSGAFREVSGVIYRFDQSGAGSVWCPEPLNFANGMALNGSGDYLYVVVSFLPGVVRIPVLPNGQAGSVETFCTLPESVPDGLAFDKSGNLYVSCYAPNTIYRVTPERQVTTLISDWEAHTLANPTNLAFGGPHMDEIYTANLGRWHITRIRASIRGLPLPSHV